MSTSAPDDGAKRRGFQSGKKSSSQLRSTLAVLISRAHFLCSLPMYQACLLITDAAGYLHFSPPNMVHYSMKQRGNNLFLTSFTTPCAPGA
eukprot:scaffold222466_cov14-Tisochrysis_lutea.AAC.1